MRLCMLKRVDMLTRVSQSTVCEKGVKTSQGIFPHVMLCYRCSNKHGRQTYITLWWLVWLRSGKELIFLLKQEMILCFVLFFLQVPALFGIDTRMLTKIVRDSVCPYYASFFKYVKMSGRRRTDSVLNLCYALIIFKCFGLISCHFHLHFYFLFFIIRFIFILLLTSL